MNFSIGEIENTTVSETDSETVSETISVLNTAKCGHLDMEKYQAIQNCNFWVEGVAMSVFGFIAIITNSISIYAFSR